MIKILFAFSSLFFFTNNVTAQETSSMYKDKIPNSKPAANEEKSDDRNGNISISKISVPTISYYPAPEKIATQTAVIIFPGGGYATNSITHEGYNVAKRFTDIGVKAFVVKYRIPNDETMVTKEIGPLQDAQQAIKLVREKAATYKINSDRIGVMGFSAGGHLASTVGTHFKRPEIANEKNTNLRPDFMILIYPVISFQPDIAHKGSSEQLIGKNPSQQKMDLYSNELQVTSQTPPTFLVHASDDSGVLPANSIRFYESLIKNKVPAELHIYQNGEHGFGLNNKTTKDDWFQRCANWMEANGWLTSGK